MRSGEKQRETKETNISAKINIDGVGESRVDTSIKFLDHMVTSLSTHSLIDIEITAKGDLIHHIAEDVAIVLGEALSQALGERLGIARFGSALVPMDDALAYASVDLVKRPYSVIDLRIDKEGIEDMVSEDILHFLRSLSTSLSANLHVSVQYGNNDHHKVEAGIKALAISLRNACSMDERRVGLPTSKGKM
jgi:imidazoleglycerol-phosphate dehydratase